MCVKYKLETFGPKDDQMSFINTRKNHYFETFLALQNIHDVRQLCEKIETARFTTAKK